MSDREEDDSKQPRLHSIWLELGVAAIGETSAEPGLEACGCEISAIR